MVLWVCFWTCHYLWAFCYPWWCVYLNHNKLQRFVAARFSYPVESMHLPLGFRGEGKERGSRRYFDTCLLALSNTSLLLLYYTLPTSYIYADKTYLVGRTIRDIRGRTFSSVIFISISRSWCHLNIYRFSHGTTKTLCSWLIRFQSL